MVVLSEQLLLWIFAQDKGLVGEQIYTQAGSSSESQIDTQTKGLPGQQTESLSGEQISTSAESCSEKQVNIQAEILTEQQIRAAFDLLDKDNNGFISKGELRDAMNAIKLHPTDKEIQSLISSVDFDQNGVISLDEFRTLVAQKVKIDELRKKFRAIDKNNTGTITYDDFYHLMLDAHHTEDQARSTTQRVFEAIDINKDGIIVFEGEKT